MKAYLSFAKIGLKFYKGDTLFSMLSFHNSLFSKKYIISVRRSSVSHMVCSPGFPLSSNPITFLTIVHAASFFRIFLREMAYSLSSLSRGNTSCIPIIIALAIPRSHDQLHHVANAIMIGIHDVFPPDKDDK